MSPDFLNGMLIGAIGVLGILATFAREDEDPRRGPSEKERLQLDLLVVHRDQRCARVRALAELRAWATSWEAKGGPAKWHEFVDANQSRGVVR